MKLQAQKLEKKPQRKPGESTRKGLIMMKAKSKEDNRKTDLVKQTPGNLKTLTK